MHFAFVPVVYDKKRQDYKVSAKECITRNDLKQFHPQLEAHMKKVFGREIGILNEKTKEGNKSIKELKDNTAISDLKALKCDLKASKVELGMIDLAKGQIQALGQIQPLENRFFNKNYVQIKRNTFNQLVNMAKNYRKDTVALQKENTDLKKSISYLEGEINKLEEKEKTSKAKFSLKKMGEKAQEKRYVLGLENKVNDLTNFIISRDLVDEYNKSVEQEKSRGFSR